MNNIIASLIAGLGIMVLVAATGCAPPTAPETPTPPIPTADSAKRQAAAAATTRPVAWPVLEGRITDAEGKPVKNVTITLYGGLATRFRGQQATTDAEGNYRFAPCETGAHMTNDDWKTASLYTGMTLEHASLASADGHSWWDVRIPIHKDSVVRQDFTMTQGGMLAGVVTDPSTGKGIPKLDLRLYTAKNHVLRYTTTDDAGKFSEPALFPGTYTIDVNQGPPPYRVLGQSKVSANQTAIVWLVHTSTTRPR